MLYRLSPLSPYYPIFGPVSQVPGLSLDPTGQVRIPASSTRTLLDNYYGEPGGAYVISVEIEDSAGWISKRDGLLAPATTSNRPPVLDPIASQTVQAGQPLTFNVRATDPDGQPLTLAATGLPAGATFTYTRGHPAVGTFTWTPTTSQVGSFGVNFDAYDTGTAPLGYQDILTDSKRAVITVQAANRSPTLDTVANLRVGVDPLNVKAFVSQTLQFEATATDPNPGDVLTYSLPILLDPNGVNRAADASINFTVTNTTNAEGQRVGRYTWTPPSSTVGVWQATVRVDDGNGGSTQQVLFISVGTFTNQSPTFSLTPPSEIFVLAGQPVSFSMTAQDPNSGQIVTLRSTGRPSGSTFTEGITGNPVSATFSWTPSASQTGNFNLSFTATDNGTPAIIQTVYTVIHVAAATPAPPTIFSLTPNRGPTMGGTHVTLRGSGFTGAVSVQLGGSAVSNLVVVDPATLTFDTPPAPQGPTDVVVTTSGGTTKLSGGFLYVLPPAPPTLTSPANGSVSTNPVVTVSGSGVPGATLTVFNRGLSIGTLSIGPDGSFQGTITLSPGEHLLTFTQTNTNGTSQPAGPYTVTIVPGVPLITAPANGFTSFSPSVMLSVTGLPGATLHAYDKGIPVAQFLIGNNGMGFAELHLGYGTHSLTVTQTLNGQTSAATNPVSGSVLPAAPTLTAPIHGYVSTNTTVPVSGTGVPGATVNVFDNGGALTTLPVDDSGHFSGTLTLAHGIHPLTFSQSHTGVTGPATAAITITLVPAAPVITAPIDGYISLNPLVTTTGTGEPDATLSLYSSGSLIATTVVDEDGSFSTVISLPPGVHQLTAIQAKGGQTSAASNAVSISIRPPAPNITAPFNGFSTTNTSVTVTGTGLPGALVTAYDSGAFVGNFIIDASGNLSGSLMLDYGTHALTFTQTNAGGTSPLTSEILLVVIPAAPVLSLPVNGFDTTNTQVAFAGSGVPGSTVTVSNGTSIATATVDGSGSFSGTLTLAHGTHTLSATQSNGGLASIPSNSVTVLVRPTAPVLILPVDGFDTTSTEVAFAGSGVPGSTVTVSNGTSSATVTVDGSGGFSGTLTLAYGTHVLSATQSNGGLTSTPSNSVRALVRPAAPVLSLPVDGFDTISTQVAFAGSGVPGSTVIVSNGTSSTTVIVDGSGSFSGTLTLAHGTHTLWATQSNGGLISAPSNSVTVLVRPAAPVLTLPVDGFDTTSTQVAFAGSGVPGSTVIVSNGTSSTTAIVDSSGSFSGTLTLAYGTHTLWAAQSNGGLTSSPSNSVTVLVRPAAPVLTLPVEGFDTTSPQVAFAGSGVPGSMVTVSNGTSTTTATVDGSGSFSGTLTLAYGTHVLSATQSNGGLTSSPSNSVTVLVRPAAPALILPVDGFDTTSTEVAFAGSGVPGSTVTVSNGTVTATATVDGSGSFSGTLTLAYGTHTLSATQFNGGLISVPSNSVTVLVRPAAPVLTLPVEGFDTTSTEVAFAGSGVPGSTVTVSNGTVTATAIVDGSGGFSGTLTLAYGTHTLSATQFNGGLISIPSNSVTVLVRPAAPVLTLPVEGFDTTITEVAFAGSGVPGSTVTVSNGTSTATAIVDSSGGFSGTLTLAYGTHTLSATQSNGGLISAPSNSVTVLVRPAAPVLILPVDGFDTTSTEMAFVGSGVPGSTVTVSNGTVTATAIVDSSGGFSGTLTLAHGTHALSATQSNGGLASASGNSVTVLVRPTAPVLSLPVDGFDTTITEVAFAGSGVPGSTVTVSNGTSSATATVDSSGSFSGALTLAHGTHTLWATQSNGGLTSSPSNSVTVLVRPAAPVLSLPVEGFDTTSTEVAFAGSGVPGSTVTISNGTVTATAIVDSSGRFSGTLTLAYGTHVLSATQSNGGLTSISSNSAAVLVRPAAPVLSLPVDGFDTTSTEVAFAGSGVPGSPVTVSNGTSSVTATVDGTGSFSGTLTLAYGTHVLSATQSNGGLTSALSNSVTVLVRPTAPVLILPIDGFDTTSTEVVFVGSGVPGSTVTVSNGTVIATAIVDGSGGFSGTLTLTYGTHALSATQSNGGLASTPSNSVTVLVRPAAPVLTLPVDGFDTTSTEVAFAGSGVPGSTVTVSNGTSSATAIVGSSGSFSGTLTLVYGTHALSAIQSNGGLTSAPSNSVTVLVRPAAPVLSLPVDGFDTTSTEVSFAGSGVPGSTVTVSNGTSSATASTTVIVDDSGRFSGTLTLAYGTHVLSATQSNGGLTSAPSNSVTVLVRPAAPVLTLPVDGFDITTTKVAFAGSGVPGSTVTVSNGTVTATAIVDSSGGFSGDLALAYGTHTLSATQSNGGLTSAPSNSVTVLVRPPPPDVTDPMDGFDTPTSQLVVSGTGLPGAKVTVSYGTSIKEVDADPITGSFEFSHPDTIDLGSTNYGVHTLSVTQSVGIHTSAPRNVTVWFRPGPPTLNYSPNKITSTDVTFGGTCEPGWEVTITDNGIANSTKLICDYKRNFSTTLKLAYGPHTLSAIQSKGVIRTDSSNDVVLNVPVPLPTIDAPINKSTTTNSTVSVRGWGEPRATLNVFIVVNNGTPTKQTIIINGDGSIAGNITLAKGSNALTFSQTVGNISSELTKKAINITYR